MVQCPALTIVFPFLVLHTLAGCRDEEGKRIQGMHLLFFVFHLAVGRWWKVACCPDGREENAKCEKM
ncbi:hypothetical protein Krac_9248 [Ktedonobacter racemifer DSM 44963]|uniref:Uncharacterized protein n=1 Tax=Ktedonobacter racemifer DSM 44963 TaxID=485913 RepID=D6TBB3_KTERA|nr:hypothetical protein Krac_9248 [Ktedonobacter racemifer DSM 44963]